MHWKRNGSGDAGTARNGIAVGLAAALVALCAGPAAAEASLSIEAPAEATTGSTQPAISGATSETSALEEVRVSIHEGNSDSGPLAQPVLSTPPTLAGTWSVVPESPLPDGTYTVLAEQQQGESLETVPSNARTFTVDTASPSVALETPSTPSNNTEPVFTGSASDTTAVTVHVYTGSHVAGEPFAKATASGTGGAFTTGKSTPALPTGEYTAVAEQDSSLGNSPGVSGEVHFNVSTVSPTVTLHPPTSPSNITTPSFTGFASETTPVAIRIYRGTRVEGQPVSEATASGDAGEWTSEAAQTPLASGTYTAIAEQASALHNPPGVSEPVTFVVETQAPRVSLAQPASPSKDTKPAFTGSASDVTKVTINIYQGTSAQGTPISHAVATGTGSAFTSGQAEPELASGTYTAQAEQESSLLGNPTGFSLPVTFVVNTASPTVTLVGPKSPGNNTEPTFSGTATDTTPVVVRILNAEGHETESTTAKPKAGGAWNTANEKALASASYTAYAEEASSLGNPPGVSTRVSFTIDTQPPAVTLEAPALRSNDTTPSFKGTASETLAVTVDVYAGPKATGTPVATASAAGTGAAWSSAPASPALISGEYTAVATQQSSLAGNGTGVSNEVTFHVDTASPTVTLENPGLRTSTTEPAFKGTASEHTAVLVEVFKGKTATGTPVASAKVAGTGGAWTSQPVALETGTHTYTAIATQKSEIGNSPGTSAPVTFEVTTVAPNVTLSPVALSPSNNTTPAFTGTASEAGPVTVHIYEFSEATHKAGNQVATATAAAAGGEGAWSSGAAAPALSGTPAGTYEAVAEEPSALQGNPAGKSSPVTFVVDTTSPRVAITSPAAGSASSNRAPTFSGTASGSEPVSITIYEDAGLQRNEVSSATANVSGGSWSSTAASPELATGDTTYTAVATEKSPLGNPAGTTEVSFTVNTLPPTVTLEAPQSPTNNRTPEFKGTASDTTKVTVSIYVGKKAEPGKAVSTATATPKEGKWVSKPAAVLPDEEHTYTAVATQPSSLKNPEGVSGSVTFVVDPEAPTVALNQPPALSNNTTPSFSGSASDHTPVTVDIYPEPDPSGEPAATASTTGTGGLWSAGPAGPALPDGHYIVRAQQESFAGHVGASETYAYTVDTVAPQVSVTGASQSSGEAALISGGAGTAEYDLPGVTVEVFSGSAIASGQAPVQSLEVGSNAGAWSATVGGLGVGEYTARAQQRDGAGNVGASSAVTFAIVPPPPSSASPPPTAGFSWLPASPHAGESISLVSSSTDAASPIVGFAWNLGSGTFAGGGPGITTSFASAGSHTVQLRVTAANGLAGVATEAIPVGQPLLPLMQPFPVVRITSLVTRSGTRIGLLSVSAPAGARITVRCSGHRCPLKSQSRAVAAGKARSAFVSFSRFERTLAPGLTLSVTVTRPGAMGKYVKLVLRRRKLPLRTDRCLAGASSTPVACPA